MNGLRAMTLGHQANSSMMLLASSTSKSVVLLERNVDTGNLTFVDAYRDGERDISTLNVSAPYCAGRAAICSQRPTNAGDRCV